MQYLSPLGQRQASVIAATTTIRSKMHYFSYVSVQKRCISVYLQHTRCLHPFISGAVRNTMKDAFLPLVMHLLFFHISLKAKKAQVNTRKPGVLHSHVSKVHIIMHNSSVFPFFRKTEKYFSRFRHLNVYMRAVISCQVQKNLSTPMIVYIINLLFTLEKNITLWYYDLVND